MAKRNISKRGIEGEGGQPGNTNAEKWDEGTVKQIGLDLIEWLCAHPANLFYSDFWLNHPKLKYRDAYDYLNRAFTSFSELKKIADEIVKNKLIASGMSGNAAMAIFVLKNKPHCMTDSPQVAPQTLNINQIIFTLPDGTKRALNGQTSNNGDFGISESVEQSELPDSGT